MEKKITKEELESKLKEIWKEEEPLIKNEKWVENGEQYSAWKIGTGGRGTVYTGDAGAAMVQKAMEEECKKMLKDYKDELDNTK